jgi:hypothetical protein
MDAPCPQQHTVQDYRDVPTGHSDWSLHVLNMSITSDAEDGFYCVGLDDRGPARQRLRCSCPQRSIQP